MKYFIIFILLTLVSCKKNNAIRVENDRESGSTITIRNYSREAFNLKGELQWTLKAKETYVYSGGEFTKLYTIYAENFEKGKRKSFITADRAEIDKKENKMKVMDNVVLKTLDGKRVEALELVYDMEKETLHSDKDVVITTKGTVLRGEGLEADNSMNKYKILKPKAVTSEGENPLKDK
ncbi:MAG: LPS export ABC transporter periplasmic protein LptC [Leptospiraceae bacterium]|nr:LPS export ABC transporter periplasmic protein LptC [Leptospiraceae bacterium]